MLNNEIIGKNLENKHGKDFPQRIIEKFNELRGRNQFKQVQAADKSCPIFETYQSTWVRWEHLSSGELSIFMLIMIEEMLLQVKENIQLLLIEEPENCMHVGMQSTILKRYLVASKYTQIFISKAADFIRDNDWAIKNRQDLGFIEEIADKINSDAKSL